MWKVSESGDDSIFAQRAKNRLLIMIIIRIITYYVGLCESKSCLYAKSIYYIDLIVTTK